MMTSKSGFAKSLEDEVKKATLGEQQIIKILKLRKPERRVADLCRKHGLNLWTLYQWRNFACALQILYQPACRDPYGWPRQPVNSAIEPIMQKSGREAYGQ